MAYLLLDQAVFFFVERLGGLGLVAAFGLVILSQHLMEASTRLRVMRLLVMLEGPLANATLWGIARHEAQGELNGT